MYMRNQFVSFGAIDMRQSKAAGGANEASSFSNKRNHSI
jgi:hypothetical protein